MPFNRVGDIQEFSSHILDRGHYRSWSQMYRTYDMFDVNIVRDKVVSVLNKWVREKGYKPFIKKGAFYYANDPSHRDDYIGFRIVKRSGFQESDPEEIIYDVSINGVRATRELFDEYDSLVKQ
jgi:hypothetical protein